MVKRYGHRYEWTKGDQGGLSILGVDIPAPYMEMFKWAYRKHDFLYSIHKKRQFRTRLSIDRELLKSQIKRLKLIGKYECPMLRAKICCVYFWVRKLGWVVWMNKLTAID